MHLVYTTRGADVRLTHQNGAPLPPRLEFQSFDDLPILDVSIGAFRRKFVVETDFFEPRVLIDPAPLHGHRERVRQELHFPMRGGEPMCVFAHVLVNVGQSLPVTIIGLDRPLSEQSSP